MVVRDDDFLTSGEWEDFAIDKDLHGVAGVVVEVANFKRVAVVITKCDSPGRNINGDVVGLQSSRFVADDEYFTTCELDGIGIEHFNTS